jgi:hypothetical protein
MWKISEKLRLVLPDYLAQSWNVAGPRVVFAFGDRQPGRCGPPCAVVVVVAAAAKSRGKRAWESWVCPVDSLGPDLTRQMHIMEMENNLLMHENSAAKALEKAGYAEWTILGQI